MDLMNMTLISCIVSNGKHIDIYRDKYGKFFIRNDGKITQKKLNASETVRYLSHIANDE